MAILAGWPISPVTGGRDDDRTVRNHDTSMRAADIGSSTPPTSEALWSIMRTSGQLPRIIRTLADHAAAGVVLISHCSSDPRHTQMLDLDALIAKHGPTAEFDYAFKQNLSCPICGAKGGGLEIKLARDFL